MRWSGLEVKNTQWAVISTQKTSCNLRLFVWQPNKAFDTQTLFGESVRGKHFIRTKLFSHTVSPGEPGVLGITDHLKKHSKTQEMSC